MDPTTESSPVSNFLIETVIETVQYALCRPMEFLAGICFLFSSFFPLYALILIISNARSYSRQVHPVTMSPMLFVWNPETTVTSTLWKKVRIECCHKMPRKRFFFFRWVDSLLMASILKNSVFAFGRMKQGWFKTYRELDQCPLGKARVISVPMENFECGETANEFKPILGMAENSYMAYQVCGERIQLTLYVSGGVADVAGYSVLIGDPTNLHPFSVLFEYHWEHIRECYAFPTRPLTHFLQDGQDEADLLDESMEPVSPS